MTVSGSVVARTIEKLRTWRIELLAKRLSGGRAWVLAETLPADCEIGHPHEAHPYALSSGFPVALASEEAAQRGDLAHHGHPGLVQAPNIGRTPRPLIQTVLGGAPTLP